MKSIVQLIQFRLAGLSEQYVGKVTDFALFPPNIDAIWTVASLEISPLRCYIDWNEQKSFLASVH